MNKENQKSLKRGLIVSVVLAFALMTGPGLWADDFPSKPIQIIVGWSAGGSEDIRARSLAIKMQEVLGQPVVVVNKPGASGTLGLNFTANAKPDGYTISSCSTSPILFTPHLQKVEFNPLTDFTYIAGTATQPYTIAVLSDAPWKTMDQLLEYVKNNPGKVKYGSAGLGHYCHVYMEVLAKIQGINWVHVPFKGDAPAMTALLGGHIPVVSISSSIIPHYKAGKVRMLAMVSENRIPMFPQIPSLKEYGFKPDLRANEVLGFNGPKGMPADVVKKLENAIKAAVDGPEFKKVMEQLDNEAKFRDSQTFTKLVHELFPKIGEMIKEAGISEIAK